MSASFHPDREAEVRVFHLFGGLGGGARGFNRGRARVGHLVARFRCIGGVDIDAAAVRDFERLAGVPGTVLDLFDREQYLAFRGKEAPADWREASADDVRAAAGGERPHIVFTSPPCKGFSGLLSESRSGAARYQALNRLTVRSVRLALEAWADDPPEFFLLENVPRIATRGRALLDIIVELLESAGYAVAETTHDCGELGGLAQSRRRFLLVARHREKVPPFLYEPPKRPLRAVGQVLGAMPLPGHPAAGPMHRMRQLQWKTWVRLAFVEAGGDWRSLQKLAVVDGYLRDFGIMPEAAHFPGVYGVTPWGKPAPTVTSEGTPNTGRFAVADPRAFEGPHNGHLGVTPWGDPAGTITGGARPGQGRFSVADPRPIGWAEYSQLGVLPWGEPCGTLSGQSASGGGYYSVADPRYPWVGAHENKMRVELWDRPAHVVTGSDRVGSGALSVADPRLTNRGPAFNNIFRIVRWDQPSAAVTGPGGAGTGLAVADPRADGWGGRGKYRVTGFDEAAGAVIAESATGNGAFAVADPRIDLAQGRGAYGVLPWDAPAGAVTAQAGPDNGRFSVADPRLPAIEQKLVAVIRSLDGTWHRPFTTLELAALQSLVDPTEPLMLDGTSDSAWRERIGNAVPPDAAAAIASEMGRALLLAWSGQTFALGSTPIWVRPVAVAIAVRGAM